eukprot:GDKJ01018523.1.p1 GENE.GDKJ01018523.1~~GDKJ01018523.1.p1  ORF type:complete len:2400 (-),score=554.77 GDKJ01018523.1:977-7951(-)
MINLNAIVAHDPSRKFLIWRARHLEKMKNEADAKRRFNQRMYARQIADNPAEVSMLWKNLQCRNVLASVNLKESGDLHDPIIREEVRSRVAVKKLDLLMKACCKEVQHAFRRGFTMRKAILISGFISNLLLQAERQMVYYRDGFDVANALRKGSYLIRTHGTYQFIQITLVVASLILLIVKLDEEESIRQSTGSTMTTDSTLFFLQVGCVFLSVIDSILIIFEGIGFFPTSSSDEMRATILCEVLPEDSIEFKKLDEARVFKNKNNNESLEEEVDALKVLSIEEADALGIFLTKGKGDRAKASNPFKEVDVTITPEEERALKASGKQMRTFVFRIKITPFGWIRIASTVVSFVELSLWSSFALGAVLRTGVLVESVTNSSIHSLQPMRQLLLRLSSAITALTNILFVFFLVILLVAIAGYILWFEVIDDRLNFDDFPWSMLAIFTIATGESSRALMFKAFEVYPNSPLPFFFFSFSTIFLNYMMLTLVLAVLLQGIDSNEINFDRWSLQLEDDLQRIMDDGDRLFRVREQALATGKDPELLKATLTQKQEALMDKTFFEHLAEVCDVGGGPLGQGGLMDEDQGILAVLDEERRVGSDPNPQQSGNTEGILNENDILELSEDALENKERQPSIRFDFKKSPLDFDVSDQEVLKKSKLNDPQARVRRFVKAWSMFSVLAMVADTLLAVVQNNNWANGERGDLSFYLFIASVAWMFFDMTLMTIVMAKFPQSEGWFYGIDKEEVKQKAEKTMSTIEKITLKCLKKEAEQKKKMAMKKEENNFSPAEVVNIDESPAKENEKMNKKDTKDTKNTKDTKDTKEKQKNTKSQDEPESKKEQDGDESKEQKKEPASLGSQAFDSAEDAPVEDDDDLDDDDIDLSTENFLGWRIFEYLVLLFHLGDFFLFLIYGDEFRVAPGEPYPTDSFIKTLRTGAAYVVALRALRPARLIGRVRMLRRASQAVFQSIPAALLTCLLLICMYVNFAIIGMFFFQNSLWYCDGQVLSTAVCEERFGVCVYKKEDCPTELLKRAQLNFDTFANSLWTLLELTFLDSWTTIMFSLVDSPGSGYLKSENICKWNAFYVIAFIVTCSIVVVNLIVSVVVSKFSSVKENAGGALFLTTQQQLWVRSMKQILRFKFNRQIFANATVSSKGFVDAKWYRATQSIIAMLYALYFLITLSTFGVKMPSVLKSVVEGLVIFLFCLDVVFRMFCLGTQFFFSMIEWCDLFISAYSALYFISSHSVSKFEDIGLVNFSALRLITTFRNFYLFPRIFGGVIWMVNSLLLALPAIANFMAFLILSFVCASLMSVGLFGHIIPELRGPYTELGYLTAINDNLSLRDFPHALVAHFLIATGDSWAAIMKDYKGQGTNCELVNQCGSNIAPVYFSGMLVLFNVVLMNMFVAIIIESFGDDGNDQIISDDPSEVPTMAAFHKLTSTDRNKSDREQRASKGRCAAMEHYEAFDNAWCMLDPRGALVMNSQAVLYLVAMLPAPLGLRSSKGPFGPDDAHQVRSLGKKNFFKKRKPASEIIKMQYEEYGEDFDGNGDYRQDDFNREYENHDNNEIQSQQARVIGDNANESQRVRNERQNEDETYTREAARFESFQPASRRSLARIPREDDDEFSEGYNTSYHTENEEENADSTWNAPEGSSSRQRGSQGRHETEDWGGAESEFTSERNYVSGSENAATVGRRDEEGRPPPRRSSVLEKDNVKMRAEYERDEDSYSEFERRNLPESDGHDDNSSLGRFLEDNSDIETSQEFEIAKKRVGANLKGSTVTMGTVLGMQRNMQENEVKQQLNFLAKSSGLKTYEQKKAEEWEEEQRKLEWQKELEKDKYYYEDDALNASKYNAGLEDDNDLDDQPLFNQRSSDKPRPHSYLTEWEKEIAKAYLTNKMGTSAQIRGITKPNFIKLPDRVNRNLDDLVELVVGVRPPQYETTTIVKREIRRRIRRRMSHEAYNETRRRLSLLPAWYVASNTAVSLRSIRMHLRDLDLPVTDSGDVTYPAVFAALVKRLAKFEIPVGIKRRMDARIKVKDLQLLAYARGASKALYSRGFTMKTVIAVTYLQAKYRQIKTLRKIRQIAIDALYLKRRAVALGLPDPFAPSFGRRWPTQWQIQLARNWQSVGSLPGMYEAGGRAVIMHERQRAQRMREASEMCRRKYKNRDNVSRAIYAIQLMMNVHRSNKQTRVREELRGTPESLILSMFKPLPFDPLCDIYVAIDVLDIWVPENRKVVDESMNLALILHPKHLEYVRTSNPIRVVEGIPVLSSNSFRWYVPEIQLQMQTWKIEPPNLANFSSSGAKRRKVTQSTKSQFARQIDEENGVEEEEEEEEDWRG